MKKTRTLILGATAFACGLASTLGRDCVIASKESSPAAEFVDAMVNHPVGFDSLGAAGKALVREIRSHGAIDDSGRLHILALSGIFAKSLLDSECEVLLSALPISVERTADGFLATLFSAVDGYIQVMADSVIDTRADDSSLYGMVKTYGVMLAGESDFAEIRGAELTRGFFDDEYILRFDVPAEFSIPDAERLVDDWLSENHSSLGRAKVTSVALGFGYRSAAPVEYSENGVRHIVSASFADVVSAYDRGASLC